MSGTETRLDNLHLNVVPTSTWLIPAEGARALTYIMTFNGGATFFHTDLDKAYILGQFTTFQTVYIDNSANTASASITFDQTQQVIIAPPGTQGYYSVQAPMFSRVTFSSTGTASVTFILLNVPVSGAVWDVAAGGVASLVSDLILEAAIGPAAPGTAATSAELVAGKYLAAGETLTNGQQSALQLTSTGALVVAISPSTVDPTYKVIAPATAAALEQQVGGVYNSAGITLTTGQGAALQQNATGALLVSDFILGAAIGPAAAGTAATSAELVAGQYHAAGETLADGQQSALQLTSTGALIVSNTGASTDPTYKIIGPSTAALEEQQVGGVYNSAGITLTTGQGAALQQNSTGALLVQDPSFNFAGGSLNTTDASLSASTKSISAGTAASDEVQVGGVFNSAPIALTNGQGTVLQMDSRGDVVTGGRGSGDLARPVYSVMQAFCNGSAALSPAGGSSALLTPITGMYIEDLSIFIYGSGTSATRFQISILDNGVVVVQIQVQMPVTATPASFGFPGLLRKYLSPNSPAGPFTAVTPAVVGLVATLTVNFTYATTTQIGP